MSAQLLVVSTARNVGGGAVLEGHPFQNALSPYRMDTHRERRFGDTRDGPKAYMAPNKRR